MLIAHDHKFVFLGVPRTASTSMHAALHRLSENFEYFGKHGMVIPPEYRSYFTFATVRNPYAREVSHYLYRHTTPGNALNKWAKNWTFAQYVEWNLDPKAHPRDFRDKPQSVHLDGTRMDCIMRFENQPQAFYDLPFVPEGFKMPVKLKRLGGKPWHHYYTAELAARVYAWAQGDFKQYGYSRDSWKK